MAKSKNEISYTLKCLYGMAWLMLVALTACLYGQVWETMPYLTPDGLGYLEFARLLKGDMYPSSDSYLVIRTVLYPLLLSALELDQASGFHEVISVNLLIHLVTSALLALLIREKVPALYTLTVCLFFFLAIQVFAASLLTEWLSAHLMLIALIVGWNYVSAPDLPRLVTLALVLTLLVLTRPVFLLFCLLIPICPFLCSQVRQKHILHSIFLVTLSGGFLLLPNGYRFGEPSISPFLGVSLSGIAGMLDHSTESGPPVRQLHLSRSDVLNSLHSEEARYNYLIWSAGEELRRVQGWNYFEYNRIMLSYSMGVIAEEPLAYLRFVSRQFFRQFSVVPQLMTCILGLLVLFAIYTRDRVVRRYLFLLLMLYELYVLNCAMTNVVFYRLIAPPLSVVLAVGVLCVLYDLTTAKRAP